MNFRNIFTAVAALAMTASAAPVRRGIPGGVEIINNLGQDVYLWSVSAQSSGLFTVPAGSSYSENWQINPNGGGVSIKMATSAADLGNVLQFEYTLASDALYWDMSSINLAKDSLFGAAGFAVTIDDTSCPTVTCVAGDVNCSQSYQFPDDHNTRACSAGAAFTLTLG